MSTIKVILHFENDQTPYIYEIKIQRWKSHFKDDSLFIPVNELKEELEISNNYRFFVSSQDDAIGSVRKEISDSDLIKVAGNLEFWLIKNKSSPGNSACIIPTRSLNINRDINCCTDTKTSIKSSASSIATGFSWSNWNRKNPQCGCSSISLLTSSVDIVQVELRMCQYVPVGLVVSGRVDVDGYDQGIFIDSVLPGSASDIDGKCCQGMLILEVNGLSLENMKNCESMQLIEEALRPDKRYISLVLAKFECPPSLKRDKSSIRSDSGTLVSKGGSRVGLTINTDMFVVVSSMLRADLPCSLPIRDRLWLKMPIANAFLGSELLKWVQINLDGISRRKEAVAYVTTMLQCGFIRDAILPEKKLNFSPQRYYVIAKPILDRRSALFSDITEHRPTLFYGCSSDVSL